MALCPKCIIEGIPVSGGGLMPADNWVKLDFAFEPDSDGEVAGVRRVFFEGEISDGDLERGLSASGVVRGNFGVAADEELEAQATLEAYSRAGAVALVTLAVRSEAGRTTFAANLVPPRDADGLGGVVFLGWPEPPPTAD